ncbi:hypothetical protein AVEN_121602-1 [Araneus ventricosus]|uniref:Uncharacterized protein n=1 Tax=Araneus ventricosus TaxID=182803 RepID=A0A4Y2LTE0_ARAVE|nr:hypothetical protein AVEN_121602-1 [Araneus ventricosus]
MASVILFLWNRFYQNCRKMFRWSFVTECGFNMMGASTLQHQCAQLPERHFWGTMDWAWWTSPLATPISRFIEPRLLFMGTSEESCLCDSS